MDRPYRLSSRRQDRRLASSTLNRAVAAVADRGYRSVEARQSEAVDAAEIVWIGRLAFAVDDQPSGLGEAHRGAPHLAQMRAPGELVLASRRGMGFGRVDRTDRARALGAAERQDRLFDGRGIRRRRFRLHGAEMRSRASFVKPLA